MDTPYAIEMLHITKRFPGIVANDDITLQLRKGEIHALLGENGAGKSTLMKMLFGLEQPTSGEIWVHGEKLTLSSPTVAISHGIGMVHQHFMLVPSLTVAENMVLGMAPRKGLFIDHAKAVAITKEYAEKYNLHVEPEAKVMDIPVGMKQKVEILKALVRGAKILILDEPTAVLTPQEIEELMQIMKNLAAEGKSILFISHKLNEIMEITDRLTIMRGGRSMGVYNTCDVTKEEISRLMVGRDVILNVQKDKAQPSDVVLRVRDVEYVNEWHKKMLDKISFDVRRGEILGIAGVEGNGQKELLEAIAGLQPAESGASIEYYAPDAAAPVQLVGKSPKAIREAGIHLSFVPEDRLGMGLVGSMGMTDNMMLKSYGEGHSPLVDHRAPRELAEKIRKELGVVTPGLNTPVSRLSGGNVQKVLVGRELAASPIVLMTAYAVRGLDINTSYTIYNLLNEQKEKGVAVIYVGEDLDVLLELCDRILVLCGGKANGMLDARTTTKEEVGLRMTNLVQKEGK